MEKQMEPDQLRQFLNRAVQEMAEYTFPYITSIVGVLNEEEGKHLGSGLRCTRGGRRAFVTAHHVILKAMSGQYQGFAVSAGYGLPPFQIAGGLDVDREGDLAICFLPPDYPEHEAVQYWPENRIDNENKSLATDYLFTHGFPGEKSRFLRSFDGLVNRSLPYGAMQRLEESDHLAAFQFALDYQPSFMRDQAGNQVAIDPHGMSGSPVWRIGVSGRSPREWSVEDSLLVGLLTEWRDDEGLLVATEASRLSAVIAP